jgi:hypothetical protein
MNISRKARVERIIFNVEIEGKKYKDICVKYSKEDNITLGDIHHEDNDSWKLINIGDKTYDFQIYGDDNSIAESNPDRILKSRLSIQLFEMRKTDDGHLEHTSHIYCNLDKSAKITYVRIDTNKGRKFANLL